jgi:SAM-dependent methyltransferase
LKKKDLSTRFFPETAAGGFSRIDGTLQFYQRVNALINPNSRLLDFGAGRGEFAEDPCSYRRGLRLFRGKVGKVIGIDVDPIVHTNPYIDEAIVIAPGDPIPLPDKSIDVVLCDHVFEHIENVQHLAKELDRVLVCNGWICARTPNRYGYIAIGNLLSPDSVKRRLLRFLQPHRKEIDIFKAFYRMNSAKSLRQIFDPAKFEHCSYYWDSEPAYHSESSLVYLLFVIIHALTPFLFKSIFMVFIRKRAD